MRLHNTHITWDSGDNTINIFIFQVAIQLGYVYNQILSVLTNTQLQQIFEKNPGFDLRHLLQGSEKFVDNILNMTDSDPSLIFAGVSCKVISFCDMEKASLAQLS